jgi:hypothetical protein
LPFRDKNSDEFDVPLSPTSTFSVDMTLFLNGLSCAGDKAEGYGAFIKRIKVAILAQYHCDAHGNVQWMGEAGGEVRGAMRRRFERVDVQARVNLWGKVWRA